MKRLLVLLVCSASLLSGCGNSSDSDESASATPVATPTVQWAGKWAVSFNGLPYLTPEDPKGELVTRDFRHGDEMHTCNDRGSVRVGTTVPQSVEGRFLLFSEQDGPTKILDNGALTGYSQTPAGAATAAYNAVASIALLDYYTSQTIDDLWDLGVSIGGLLKPGEHYPELGKTNAVSLPYGFRVLSCTSRTAQVELLVDPAVPGEYAIITLPMVYENDTWIVRMTAEMFANNARRIAIEDIEWETWTKWNFG
ncbi:hypothetical protein [Corynebacterium sp. HS2168-gen11]|uniref:hypothetical protein n=1 Tax=Corynebacterium sp. HS2168-gen11 TaxID=2974027 RepID=UPI00216B49F4|nr:hypothetical protein [Corynebacterium sp. HS2168-gen11]MCS4535501.1 hypothetical protein [Corynebacterium sp. HS2168-gen11]